MAARDGCGKLWWGTAQDAVRYVGTTLQGDELLSLAGKWILRDGIITLLGGPGEIIRDEQALEWLLENGHVPPDELADGAEQIMLAR